MGKTIIANGVKRLIRYKFVKKFKKHHPELKKIVQYWFGTKDTNESYQQRWFQQKNDSSLRISRELIKKKTKVCNKGLNGIANPRLLEFVKLKIKPGRIALKENTKFGGKVKKIKRTVNINGKPYHIIELIA